MGNRPKLQKDIPTKDNGLQIKSYRITPIVKRLSGLITLPLDFDYKVEKAKYLEDKYFPKLK